MQHILFIREHRARRAERGQNLLEFALLTPFVLVFIGAIVIFGFALNTRSSLQQGVREGARQAAVGATLAEVQDLAAANSQEVVDPANYGWCHPDGPTGTRGRIGDPVTVFVLDDDGSTEGYNYTVAPATGIFNLFGVQNVAVRMKPRATARLETTFNGALVDCP